MGEFTNTVLKEKLLEIMAITGHRTMSVFRRYNTVEKQDLRAAAARLHAARSGPVTLARGEKSQADRKRRMA